MGDWDEVYRALPRRIEEWMDRLSGEGIKGADLVFACIGPALELYSRYRAVETPAGEVVGLSPNPEAGSEPARRGYLSYVWEVVGRTALGRVLGGGAGSGDGAGALEEGARLTALFLWTVQTTKIAANGEAADDDEADDDAPDDEEAPRAGSGKKGLVLIYDVVRRFAQPLGIHLDQWEGRVVETEKGVVRLLPVRRRAHQLFGADGAAMAGRLENAARAGRGSLQGVLFAELAAGDGASPAGGIGNRFHQTRSPSTTRPSCSGRLRPRRSPPAPYRHRRRPEPPPRFPRRPSR